MKSRSTAVREAGLKDGSARRFEDAGPGTAPDDIRDARRWGGRS